MAFQNIFREGINQVNNRARYDRQIQYVLNKYNGRAFVLNVTDDTTYLFYISSSGVTLTVSPPSCPNDMYLETRSEIIRKIMERKIGAFHIPWLLAMGQIKYRNISVDEINLVRRLVG